MLKDKEYYENLDKRTKEFKEWRMELDSTPKTQEELNAKHEANPTIETTIGAGDIVEKITKATGIKAVIDYFTPEGKDCGCDERKEKLNRLPVLKNKSKVECLTVEEYNFLKPLLSNNNPISGKHASRLLEIYERVFNVKVISSCNGCSMSKKINELKGVLGTYE